jgi:hypothetical protein
MVNYRFDTLRCALRVAIPRTYDMVLFEESARKKRDQHGTEQAGAGARQQEDTENRRKQADFQKVREELPGVEAALAEGGR